MQFFPSKMKKLAVNLCCFSFVSLFSTQAVYAENTTWDLTNPGNYKTTLDAYLGQESSTDPVYSSLASSIPGDYNDHLLLGTPFNSHEKEAKNFGCVTGTTTETLGNTNMEFQNAIDLSYEQMVDKIGGSVSIETNFPVVKVGASATLAIETASDEFSSTYTLYAKSTPKRRTLTYDSSTGMYGLSSICQNYSDNYQSLLMNKVGDEFIQSIKYGATLVITMKVEYRSAADKLAIGGKINASFGKVVELEGSLDYLDEETKSSVKITIHGIQNGGDPLKLLTIIPDNLVACSLSNPQPCFDVFDQANTYITDDFPTQFATLDKYNVVEYNTERYEDSALEALVPSTAYETVTLIVKELQKDLDAGFQQALLDRQRATSLLSSYYSLLSAEQLAAVQSIKDDSLSNASYYSNGTIYCYENPYGNSCKDYIDTYVTPNVINYDRSVLEIASAGEAPNIDQCENARVAAVNARVTSDYMSEIYRGISWAPMFYNNAQPSQGISGWSSCENVVSSYGDYFK